MEDVTDKNTTLESLTYVNDIIQSCDCMVVVVDEKNVIEFVNESLAKATGYDVQELCGSTIGKILDSPHKKNSCNNLLCQDGTKIPVLVFDYSVCDATNKPKTHTLLAYKIETLAKIENKLDQLIQFDVLTNLPNRLQFEIEIKKNIAHSLRHKKNFALMMLDLDNFKFVNDTYGHDVGDLLLQEIGKQLKAKLRVEDFVARIGGDEFVVIASEIGEAKKAGFIAEKILEIIQKQYILNGHKINVGCSIGIAIFPMDGMDKDTLLKKADIAMYSVKRDSKNNYKYFNVDLLGDKN